MTRKGLIYFLTKLIPNRKLKKLARLKFLSKASQEKALTILREKGYLEQFSKQLPQEMEAVPLRDVKTHENVIWQFWAQGEDKAPSLVKKCFESVERHKGSHQRIVLDVESVRDWIELPQCIRDKFCAGQITWAHFSDILRIALLKEYGGIWLDATVFLSDYCKEFDSDFFVPQRSSDPPEDWVEWVKFNEGYFCWDSDFHVRSLSSVMVANPQCEFLQAIYRVLMHYWTHESQLCHYFLLQLIFDELLQKPEFLEFKNYGDDLAPHRFQRVARQEYDENVWNFIKQQSTFHKLTYFRNLKEGSMVQVVLGL